MRYEETGIGQEPFTVEEARDWVRNAPPDGAEDALIGDLITAAREYVENVTGRALASRRITAWPDALHNGMKLPYPPAKRIVRIRYRDLSGELQEMDPADYELYRPDGAVYFRTLPAYSDPVIEYECGYPGTPPAALKTAMKLLVAHWYTNREAVQIGSGIAAEVPELGVRRLCNQYKVWWF